MNREPRFIWIEKVSIRLFKLLKDIFNGHDAWNHRHEPAKPIYLHKEEYSLKRLGHFKFLQFLGLQKASYSINHVYRRYEGRFNFLLISISFPIIQIPRIY